VSTPPEDDRLQAQIAFAIEIDKLRRVIRRNTLMDGSRRENAAEHSWYLGLLATVLSEYAPPGTDLPRVVAMLLVHDLVQMDLGVDGAAATEQARAAADRIFGLLPADQARPLHTLWEEFAERRTPEARFAGALDGLVPILANHRNDGGTWSLYKVTADHVREMVKVVEEGAPRLGAYASDLVELSVRRGQLRR
jgi:putative hydrolase of HD superfamily